MYQIISQAIDCVTRNLHIKYLNYDCPALEIIPSDCQSQSQKLLETLEGRCLHKVQGQWDHLCAENRASYTGNSKQLRDKGKRSNASSGIGFSCVASSRLPAVEWALIV